MCVYVCVIDLESLTATKYAKIKTKTKHKFTVNHIILHFSILFTDVDIQNRF